MAFQENERTTPLLHDDLTRPNISPFQEKMYLYGTHSIQAFGDRAWAFAVPILFMDIWPNTLIPTALFQFSIYLVTFLVLAPVGRWIDRTNRMKVMSTAIWAQGLLITANCALVWVLLAIVEPGRLKVTWGEGIVFFFILLTAAAAEAMGNAATLSLERDWVVVICDNDSERLTEYNAALRRIDLLCLMLAPTIYGLIMEFTPFTSPAGTVRFGTAMVALWNLIAIVPEYVFAKKLYNAHAELAVKKAADEKAEGEEAEKTGCVDVAKQSVDNWKQYLTHPVFVASLSYCMLFFTVLDNGTLMTAYLKWAGVSPTALGASRGVGAAVGIIGTMFFPSLTKCLGSIKRAGMFGIWGFFLMILPAALVFCPPLGYTPHKDDEGWAVHGYVMLASVAFSRMLLWAYDLAHTQVMQEGVEEDRRGLINGCQTATFQLMWVALAVCSLYFSHPSEFPILIVVSVFMVGLAAAGWSTWAVCLSSEALDKKLSVVEDDPEDLQEKFRSPFAGSYAHSIQGSNTGLSTPRSVRSSVASPFIGPSDPHY